MIVANCLVNDPGKRHHGLVFLGIDPFRKQSASIRVHPRFQLIFSGLANLCTSPRKSPPCWVGVGIDPIPAGVTQPAPRPIPIPIPMPTPDQSRRTHARHALPQLAAGPSAFPEATQQRRYIPPLLAPGLTAFQALIRGMFLFSSEFESFHRTSLGHLRCPRLSSPQHNAFGQSKRR